MTVYDIIIKPILSEKSFAGIPNKDYTFKVHPDATKGQIKNAVETVFKGVTVERVNVANFKGKPKRQGRNEGHRPSWKKAYVKLTDDSKAIEFFEGLR